MITIRCTTGAMEESGTGCRVGGREPGAGGSSRIIAVILGEWERHHTGGGERPRDHAC